MPTGFSSSLTFCLTVTNSRCERTNYGASDLSADRSISQSNSVGIFTNRRQESSLTHANKHHLTTSVTCRAPSQSYQKEEVETTADSGLPKNGWKNVILMEQIWCKQNNFEHGFILSGISRAVCCLWCDSLVMFSQHSRGRSLSKRTSFECRSLC